jgi:hypothetical protein
LNESKGIPRATNAALFYQKATFFVQMERISKTAGRLERNESVSVIKSMHCEQINDL